MLDALLGNEETLRLWREIAAHPGSYQWILTLCGNGAGQGACKDVDNGQVPLYVIFRELEFGLHQGL
jgi:hypothetical protein